MAGDAGRTAHRPLPARRTTLRTARRPDYSSGRCKLTKAKIQNGDQGLPSQAARKGLAVLRARFQPAWSWMDKDHEKGGGFDGILHMELLSDDNRGPQRQRR